jgi:hypothetical protein
MFTFKEIRDSYRFIDWLVASACLENLRWLNRLGVTVYATPSDDLFMGADEELFQAWEDLSWSDQRFCIIGAAEQLAEIEQLVAGAV